VSGAARLVESDVEYILKMVALGDGAVGKTSCIMRFTEDSFGEKYKATIGTSIAIKNLQVEIRKGEITNTQIVLWYIPCMGHQWPSLFMTSLDLQHS